MTIAEAMITTVTVTNSHTHTLGHTHVSGWETFHIVALSIKNQTQAHQSTNGIRESFTYYVSATPRSVPIFVRGWAGELISPA